jgi:hypothetical protein
VAHHMTGTDEAENPDLWADRHVHAGHGVSLTIDL